MKDSPDGSEGGPPDRGHPDRPALSRLDPDRGRSPTSASPGSGPKAPTGPGADAVDSGPEDGAGDPGPTAGVADPSSGAGLNARPAAVDTRRYRWMIGTFGLALVVVVSVYQFATHGVGTTGIAPGQRLHWFAAPLANTTLIGDPNLAPPCTLARHDPRALNICLIARREPLVLSFFVTGSSDCERQVDALQKLSQRYRPQTVQFAAVAVSAGRASTRAVIRRHHWTIPIAYDRDGSVGALYGVAVCPMAELAYRGGVVFERLIGDRWQSFAALAARVRALVNAVAPGR